MLKRKSSVFVLLCAIVLMAFSQAAWAITVGLVFADVNNDVVKNYLAGTGLIAGADITNLDITTYTPTLTQLSAFDAVMVWSNYGFDDAALLGDRLADYVDAGGGVVIAGMAFSNGPDRTLAGRIMTTSYSPFTPTYSVNASDTLGSYEQTHPIMDGVSSLLGSYRDLASLNPGAVPVAYWNSGGRLVATQHGGQVVGITLYPGQSNNRYGMGGDYARLYANSLLYSASTGSEVPEPGSLAVLAAGLVQLAFLARRRA